MVRNKLRKLLILLMIGTLATGMTPISAYAGWKQDSKGWWYDEGNSWPRSCWRNIDGKWYYFNYDGYMMTGWHVENKVKDGYFIQSQTFYYLNEDGSLDESRTTTEMPDELAVVRDLLINFEIQSKYTMFFDGILDYNYYNEFGFSDGAKYVFDAADYSNPNLTCQDVQDIAVYDPYTKKISLSCTGGNTSWAVIFDSEEQYDSLERKGMFINAIRNWGINAENFNGVGDYIFVVTEEQDRYKVDEYRKNCSLNDTATHFDTTYYFDKSML